MNETRPIGILGAMAVEIEALLAGGTVLSAEEHASMTFYRVRFREVPCVVVQCGVGKVHAGMCAQVLADRYDPRLILNIGVAGGTGPQVHIGDLVVASHCIQHDFDTTAIGEPMATLTLPGCGMLRELPCAPEAAQALLQAARGLYGNAHLGPVASGDRFVADKALGAQLYQSYGALACEMEGGAVAQVCLLNHIPCAVLRAISDGANDDSPTDFPAFARESAYKAQQLLAAVVGSL